MESRKRLLKNSSLYAIIDKETLGNRRITGLVNRIKDSGSSIGIIQLRDKISHRRDVLEEALCVKGLLRNTKALFIVNDYLDIAKIVDADGIHLGQDDMSVKIARRLLGRDKLIGISCHSLLQARKAQSQGADYISVGPVFATPTKPEYKATGLELVKAVSKNIKIPFFVIGGINAKNIKRVLSYGAKRVAVCRAICRAKDAPSAARYLSKILS